MLRVTLALLTAIFAIFAVTSALATTCADGGILCGAACHTSSACASAGGNDFAGMCIGGSNQSSSTCLLTRCGSNTPACGAPTNISGRGQGCSTDAQCGSGYICVSSAGPGSCGTGWSQCISSCSDSTTTTTSTTSTSTTT